MKKIIKEIPVKIFKNKTKQVNLNLNIYRNLHYFTKNTMKVNYKQKIIDIFIDEKPFPIGTQIELKFIYFHKDKRKIDLSNPNCIIDKFLCDALVSINYIEEDNVTIIPKITYGFGGVNKGKSTCILEIKEYNNKNEFEKYKRYINS